MSLRSWGSSLGQALRSLTYGGLMSLASVATVAISLLVLSVVVLLAVNMELIATTAESQVEVKAYLPVQVTLTAAEGQQLAERVAAIDGVKSATFIPKSQGLEQMREWLGPYADVVGDLESNPLPDSIAIELADLSRAAEVAARVEAIEGIESVDYGRGLVEKLLRLTQALRLAGAGLVLLLVVATVLTISNTIRQAVFAHRREIAIMKLVGATDWFIRRPFVVEGILLGAIGSGLAMLGIGLGYRYLVASVHTNMPFLPVVPAEEIVPRLTYYLLGLGAALGAIGSSISLRRFLKV